MKTLIKQLLAADVLINLMRGKLLALNPNIGYTVLPVYILTAIAVVIAPTRLFIPFLIAVT